MLCICLQIYAPWMSQITCYIWISKFKFLTNNKENNWRPVAWKLHSLAELYHGEISSNNKIDHPQCKWILKLFISATVPVHQCSLISQHAHVHTIDAYVLEMCGSRIRKIYIVSILITICSSWSKRICFFPSLSLHSFTGENNFLASERAPTHIGSPLL